MNAEALAGHIVFPVGSVETCGIIGCFRAHPINQGEGFFDSAEYLGGFVSVLVPCGTVLSLSWGRVVLVVLYSSLRMYIRIVFLYVCSTTSKPTNFCRLGSILPVFFFLCCSAARRCATRSSPYTLFYSGIQLRACFADGIVSFA